MNIKLLGVAVLAGVVVAGCDKAKTAKEDEKVLSVNGEVLMRSAIDADVDAILKAHGDKIPEDQKSYYRQMAQNQAAQSFIFEKILVAKAKADGYSATDAELKERETDFMKNVSKTPNAPKTIEEYYAKHPFGEARARREFVDGLLIEKMIKAELAKEQQPDYVANAKATIATIVSNNNSVATAEKSALDKIKSLKAELDKTPAAMLPAKFAELAKANSECPSSSKGGDLGEFTHGQMVKEFDQVAFSQPVNVVSDPVKTQFGYHLVMVTKKIPAVKASGTSPESPEKVCASHILVKTPGVQTVPKEDELIDSLKKQSERVFAQKFVMGLVKKAKIEAFADDFKQFVPPEEKPAEASVEKPAEK